MTDNTIEDRIAARIARVPAAKDQVVRTLVSDLKASIREAEAGGRPANHLERRAVEVLERLIAPGASTAAIPPPPPPAPSVPLVSASKRRRKPTRAEKVAASQAGA
jgi:hypothetical protein